MSLKIFWQPSSFNLDSIGKKRLVSVSDGDTPNIQMSVRMLSIDAAETSTMRMPKAPLPQNFQDLAAWIESGKSPVQPALAEHLLPRLRRSDGKDPFAVHIEQGQQGKEAYKALTEDRLKRPSGYYRSLFVRVADQPFDHYGRLLAYVAPHYEPEELQAIPRDQRTTFNLDMVAAGWAAPFVLYPSIPNELDLPRLQQAARLAVEQGKGCWADRFNLTGYEYRMCIKLIQLMLKTRSGAKLASGDWHGWIDRYCADMSSGEVYRPQEYVRVAPWNRIFIWNKDVRQAVATLNLEPAGALTGQ